MATNMSKLPTATETAIKEIGEMANKDECLVEIAGDILKLTREELKIGKKIKEIQRLEESKDELADNQKEKIKKRPELEEQLEKLQVEKKSFETSEQVMIRDWMIVRKLHEMRGSPMSALLDPETKFFILKPRKPEDLVQSVKDAVWYSPYDHVRGIREAWRERGSSSVVLLFSSHATSELSGFAKMLGEPRQEGFAALPVEWIKTCKVPYRKIKELRNPLAAHEPLTSSRDGQAVPGHLGRRLCALMALAEDNGSIPQKGLSANPSTEKNQSGGGFIQCKIFVGGLPITCSEAQFREYFERYGAINKCEFKHGRCFGYITYETPDAVDAVLSKYSHHIINKKWVEVKRSIPREVLGGSSTVTGGNMDLEEFAEMVRTGGFPSGQQPAGAGSPLRQAVRPPSESPQKGTGRPAQESSDQRNGANYAPDRQNSGGKGGSGDAGRIKHLVEMGFSREMAQQTLATCGWDLNAAIDKLLSSMPPPSSFAGSAVTSPVNKGSTAKGKGKDGGSAWGMKGGKAAATPNSPAPAKPAPAVSRPTTGSVWGDPSRSLAAAGGQTAANDADNTPAHKPAATTAWGKGGIVSPVVSPAARQGAGTPALQPKDEPNGHSAVTPKSSPNFAQAVGSPIRSPAAPAAPADQWAMQGITQGMAQAQVSQPVTNQPAAGNGYAGDHNAEPVAQNTNSTMDTSSGQNPDDLSIALEVVTDFSSPDQAGAGTQYLELRRGESVRVVALNLEHLDNGGGWVYGKTALPNGQFKDGWFPRTCLGPEFLLVRIQNNFEQENSTNKSCMGLAANDLVYVEQQHDSGWTLGRKTNKGGLFVERGWFPYDFCRPIKL